MLSLVPTGEIDDCRAERGAPTEVKRCQSCTDYWPEKDGITETIRTMLSMEEVFSWLLLDTNWLSPVDLAVVLLLRPTKQLFDWLMIDWWNSNKYTVWLNVMGVGDSGQIDSYVQYRVSMDGHCIPPARFILWPLPCLIRVQIVSFWVLSTCMRAPASSAACAALNMATGYVPDSYSFSGPQPTMYDVCQAIPQTGSSDVIAVIAHSRT